MPRIPLFDGSQQTAALRTEIGRAIDRVIDAQRFILGEEVACFEAEMAAYLGVSHAIGVSSGTDALTLALLASGVAPGDEVITTPYSFFATTGAILRVGATPVFADIEPDGFNLDPARVSSVITSRTRAILPVHLFGQPASMSDLSALAHEHSLLVIEDAAQAIGATFEDRQVGSLGNAGCFSFFPTKNLGAFGDGGLLTTNDQALAETVRALRSHGFSPKHHSRRVGGNFRLDALQAAILRVKLPHLPGWIERRQAHAQRYLSALAPLLDDPRSGAADLGLPHARPGRSHVYNQFVLQTPERDALAAHLARRGIESERYYPVPIHLQESCAPLGYQLGDFPNAEALARTCLALPMYPELEEWMIDSITQALLEFYAR